MKCDTCEHYASGLCKEYNLEAMCLFAYKPKNRNNNKQIFCKL